MICNRFRAGALQLTLFVMVIVALLLTSFVLLINTHNRFRVHSNFVIETIEQANFGVNYLLVNQVDKYDSLNLNLQSEEYKTLSGYVDFWGVFEKVSVVSRIKKNTFKRNALIGTKENLKKRTALYLEDNKRPLVLVGNTRIEGLSYLPDQGVRTGNISGHSYYGNQLIYGDTQVSGQLPNLSKDVLDNINKIEQQIDVFNPDQFLSLSKKSEHKNSFTDKPAIIYSNSEINLAHVKLTGHIIVQSKTQIIVNKTASLKDVVLIAPTISFESGVKGSVQAIATKEITVGEECELDYPSALVLNEKVNLKSSIVDEVNTEEKPLIQIEEGSNIKGVVICLVKGNNYKAQILIGKNAVIEGEVYCDRNLELLGMVYGSVYTSNIVANQSGSIYHNHLYNATISSDKLPEQYVGLTYENSQHKEVMLWLY